jgi:hypothetical protein
MSRATFDQLEPREIRASISMGYKVYSEKKSLEMYNKLLPFIRNVFKELLDSFSIIYTFDGVVEVGTFVASVDGNEIRIRASFDTDRNFLLFTSFGEVLVPWKPQEENLEDIEGYSNTLKAIDIPTMDWTIYDTSKFLDTILAVIIPENKERLDDDVGIQYWNDYTDHEFIETSDDNREEYSIYDNLISGNFGFTYDVIDATDLEVHYYLTNKEEKCRITLYFGEITGEISMSYDRRYNVFREFNISQEGLDPRIIQIAMPINGRRMVATSNSSR